MKTRILLLALLLLAGTPAQSQGFLNKLNKKLESATKKIDKILGVESDDNTAGKTTEQAKASTGKTAPPANGKRLTAEEVENLYPTQPRITENTKVVYVEQPGKFTDFSDGVAWVQANKGGGWIPIDTEGNRISNYTHNIIFAHDPKMPYYSNGVTVVQTRVGNSVGIYLMNKKGEMVKQLSEISGYSAFNNRGIAAGYVSKRKPNHAGNISAYDLYPVFFDTNGDIMYRASTPMRDNDDLVAARNFSDDRMLYFDYDVRRWGFLGIDADDRLVPWFEPQYTAAHNFSEGLAAVRDAAGNWGYIDVLGTMVIEPKFSHEPSDFSGGYAVARKRENGAPFVYIDKTGKVVKENLISAEPFDAAGYAFVSMETDNGVETFLMDRNLEFIHKFDRNESPGIYIGGNYYYYLSWGERLLAIDGMEGQFVEGLARINYNADNGQKIIGFARPDGEMAIVFKQPEF